jgi:hypothetical protein
MHGSCSKEAVTSRGGDVNGNVYDNCRSEAYRYVLSTSQSLHNVGRLLHLQVVYHAKVYRHVRLLQLGSRGPIRTSAFASREMSSLGAKLVT